MHLRYSRWHFRSNLFAHKSFGWESVAPGRRGMWMSKKEPRPPCNFSERPNPCFDECAVMEKDTTEGLARAFRVVSSRDCVRLKHTEFHTELARPAGTERYWFSNRVVRGGKKCCTQTREERGKRALCEKSSTCRRPDKKAEWQNVGTWPLKLHQCHPDPL